MKEKYTQEQLKQMPSEQLVVELEFHTASMITFSGKDSEILEFATEEQKKIKSEVLRRLSLVPLN